MLYHRIFAHPLGCCFCYLAAGLMAGLLLVWLYGVCGGGIAWAPAFYWWESPIWFVGTLCWLAIPRNCRRALAERDPPDDEEDDDWEFDEYGGEA